MSKEIKVGIVVVTLLAAVFCGVLYQRVSKLKQTPVAATGGNKQGEKKSLEKPGLFGSPNKLVAVAGKDAKEVEASAATDSTFKWSSQASDAGDTKDTAKSANVSAPPRASFMPANDEPIKADDRYASRFAKPEEPAATPEAATPDTAEISVPVAAANPFRSAASIDGPTATVDEPAAAAVVSEAAPSNSLISSNDSSTANDTTANSTSPPPIDEDTVPTAAVAPPRTSRFNVSSRADNSNDATQSSATEAAAPSNENRYARPASRFITSDDETAVTPPPASRFATPSARSTIAAQGRGGDAVSSGKYTVEPNDNYWAISERIYGTGGYFKALHAYNKEKFPAQDDLAVGDVIAVPPAVELERQFPDLCPKQGRRPTTKQSYAVQASAKLRADGKTYVVQEGDTLFDIARYELGKASRWSELYELNRDAIGDDLDFLRPGMELTLPPEKRAGDAMTRQPGSSLR